MSNKNEDMRGPIDAFLNQSFESMLKELNKKQIKLREIITSSIDLFSTQEFCSTIYSNAKETNKNYIKVMTDLNQTLKVICESKVPKLVVLAIDCFQKLLVSGSFQGIVDSENQRLVDRVVEIILSCVEYPDDGVQLQIVRTLSSAVTSPLCDIHENSLTNSFSKSVNIYLQSKNANQNTIKEALSSMLTYLFQKFEEANFSKDKLPEIKSDSFESSNDSTEIIELKEEKKEETIENEQEGLSTDDNNNRDESNQPQENEISNEDSTIPSIPNEHEDQIDIKKVDENKEVNENNQAKNERIVNPTPAAHVFGDCFLIFRALCKLSQKDLSPTSSSDSVDMKRKLLSLELLQLVVDHAGPALKSNDRFISQAIKKYLVISILNNGVSPFPKVFRLSLNIFNGLLANFKDYLRNEIGIYFSKILLRILASNNSAIQQKHAVLKFLLNVCKNAQTLVDIFLNYDCHLESEDLFESMVNYFAAIAKGYSTDANFTPQENEVCLLALECLVTIMKSQVAWSSELAEEVHSESDNSNEPNHNLNRNDSDRHLISKKKSYDKSHPSPVFDEIEAVDQFAKIKLRKQQLEHGKRLFNLKPKKGIKYLIESNILHNTSISVAKFLLQEEGLNKTQIGTYIGDISDPFCISVLYDYVDIQKFSNQSIDSALRNFLSYFRLPGESQKIDKIMEKFAERYYNDNVSVNEKFPFENADAAYIFAFHMIMLATDLHNVAIRKKMSKQEWIKNNTGLNDGKDFGEQFLIEIYDSIQANEIKTRDNISSQNYNTSDILNPKQRQMIFQKESKMVVQQSQDIILEKLQKKSTFFKSNNIQHVKPMFEMCWCPMLAAFSVILETDADDNNVFSLCLEGFKCAIRVSSIFYLETERNAFVTSLCQFTLLSNTREMKQKNIHAIKCLIAIANEDGNYLQDSWSQVLNCISQLAKIHLIGSGAKTFSEFTPSDEKTKRNPTPSSDPNALVKRSDSTKLYEGVNASSVVDQINVNDIDKIYSNTTHLNNNAIVEFVKCLCDVSEMEVNSAEPRTFSLQKLVELAYFNMERIRFVWSRIWVIMANHFVKVACHKNLKVAMYAVDSLRQLAVKFLEKDELANYHFQKDFLKPFELIMTNNSALQIRELVIRCVSQIILSKSENIKSGWKSMLMVFAFAANDRSEMIANLAYEMVGVIMEKCFHLIKSTFFVECVNCLVSFAKSDHSKEICCKAVESIEFCANQLAKGDVAINQSLPATSDSFAPSATEEFNEGEMKFNDGEVHLRYWFPILTGLSQVVSHQNVDVRSHALDKLYTILTGCGPLFTNGLWKLIFRGVLLPIFDNVNYVGDEYKEENEWLGTTCLKALTYFVELFSLFFDRLQFLLIDFLSLLSSCTLTENENLATISCSCLLHFCLTNGASWNSEIWTTFCKTLNYIITHNLCHELLFIGKPNAEVSVKDLLRTSDDQISLDEEHNLDQNLQISAPSVSIDLSVNDVDNFEIPFGTLDNKLIRSTPKKRNPNDLKVIAGKSTVHVELIAAIKQVFETHYLLLNEEHISYFLNSLYETYTFAHSANNNKDIWKSSGIMSIVIKQETTAISVYLQILFTLYNADEDWKRKLAEEKLTLIVATLIKDYLDVDDKVAEIPPSYFSSKVPAICQALQGYNTLSDEQFLDHFGNFYEHFADLFTVAEQSVRVITKDIFLRFGKLNSVI